MNLAAENFLLPNGTFFVCLLIFVIVFLVIRTMVVPPILKVLDDRDAMIAKTAEDNRAAAASYEDADTEYRAALKDARGDATGIRDEARAKGNEQLAEAKRRATEEADAVLADTTKQLKAEGDQAASTARDDVDALSSTLASRVLGVDVSAKSTEKVN
ncbi:F0F1 ATP synthase subunit B [Gordonia sp. SID5947]|uniref:F0F1 ATP synthase subunit B n=1 Tax=Gordonia sp. SID5947 TaxID=2690315 RepID=UPI00136D8284|nr:F0F1 ATP synthase subunit B [Gordonia sp. SID5947]MYR06084.1 F0F1 ATP synthase subunit B [Gordonia sp. SID5947]